MKFITTLIACVFLLGAAPAPSVKPPVPTNSELRYTCPAPGMPSIADLKQVWKIVELKTFEGPTEGTNAKQPVSLIVYQNGAAFIAIVYNKHGEPIFVDLAAQDETVPLLLSNQWLAPTGNLREQPEGPCVWRKKEKS